MRNLLLLITLLAFLRISAQDENYQIKNLEVNTPFQDFGVAFMSDTTVVFSTSKKEVFMRRVWSGNHQPFLSLKKGIITADSEIENVREFADASLDSKFHESSLVFTKDHQTVYFSRNNYLHNKYRTDSIGVNLIQIYRAQRDSEGKWSQIETLPFNSDEYQTGHPALSADESQLYFVSNMPGTHGETDIYVVDIHSDGSFGEPINLGETVNTSQSEMFPFIDENNVLYFSSNGLNNSLGALDVYATQKNADGIYYTPKNLGSPVNSSFDDFAFVKQRGKQTGYFASNRKGGKGDDDIYALLEMNPIQFNCNIRLSTTTYNAKNKKSLDNVHVRIMGVNASLFERTTDAKGFAGFKLECNKDYIVTVTKEGFSDSVIQISSENSNMAVDLALVPNLPEHIVSVGDELRIKLQPTYFDYNKASIKTASESQLNIVYDIMQKYPNILMQIRAFTDSRGNDFYNLKLSEKRAESCRQWLLNKGISKDRIVSVGFGEQLLVNECNNDVSCSEEKHQENRRIEFVILNPIKGLN